MTTNSSEKPTVDTKNPVRMVTFNVLAPCWASPGYYPKSSTPFLDREMRRERITRFLTSIVSRVDIIALQETTETEFMKLEHTLQSDFYAFQAYHDRHYWSDWVTVEVPWERNGVSLFVKKDAFNQVKFQDVPLSDGGNHSVHFEGILQGSEIRVRAASIHLESEDPQARHRELHSLLNFMTPSPGTYDIIAGDFNFGTQGGIMGRLLEKSGFVDVLASLGREEWTIPYSTGEYSARDFGILDHIVVRNALPTDGSVYNSGLWQTYPSDDERRVAANLQTLGSDHFPVFGAAKAVTN